jgi:hypothetical protein
MICRRRCQCLHKVKVANSLCSTTNEAAEPSHSTHFTVLPFSWERVIFFGEAHKFCRSAADSHSVAAACTYVAPQCSSLLKGCCKSRLAWQDGKDMAVLIVSRRSFKGPSSCTAVAATLFSSEGRVRNNVRFMASSLPFLLVQCFSTPNCLLTAVVAYMHPA